MGNRHGTPNKGLVRTTKRGLQSGSVDGARWATVNNGLSRTRPRVDGATMYQETLGGTIIMPAPKSKLQRAVSDHHPWKVYLAQQEDESYEALIYKEKEADDELKIYKLGLDEEFAPIDNIDSDLTDDTDPPKGWKGAVSAEDYIYLTAKWDTKEAQDPDFFEIEVGQDLDLTEVGTYVDGDGYEYEYLSASRFIVARIYEEVDPDTNDSFLKVKQVPRKTLSAVKYVMDAEMGIYFA